MNRRDFLRLTRPPPQVLGLLNLLDEVLQQPSAEPALLRFGRRAMATSFEVILPFATPNATAAANMALDLIDQLEDQLSIYRPHSEVSRLNVKAQDEAVPVEANLFDLMLLARQLHEATDRAFDVAMGSLIKAWGFHARAGRVPAVAELSTALACSGMSHVLLDPAAKTVAFEKPHVEINLGSIGKGYALDRAMQTLWRDCRVTTALLHAGHSSIFAVGNEPGRNDGWPVLLSDPRDSQRSMGLFRLRNRAMGTSAATHQHLMHEGRKLGHILDPRTGWPAEGLLSATVTNSSAAVADALATAFFILGSGPAEAYCQSHGDIGVVLIPDVPEPSPIALGRAREEFLARV